MPPRRPGDFTGSEWAISPTGCPGYTCGRADFLFEKGYVSEAKRLLGEAALLEPEAGMVRERLRAIEVS
jgi:hypothetical protein